MAVKLSAEDFQQLTHLLAQSPDFALARSRYGFVSQLFVGNKRGEHLLTQIDFDGSAALVASELVRLLAQYGEIFAGREALSLLLDALLAHRGEDEQADFLRQIIDRYQLKRDVEPNNSNPITTLNPAVLPQISEDYVFISYARPQAPIAQALEQFLSSAGIRTFRDVSAIQAGMDWNQTIEQALSETTKLVLLLSSASMPYRKEVYREWFAFDQANKPILPLLIETCQLPSRLLSIQYIDARSDLKQAFEHLLKALAKR